MATEFKLKGVTSLNLKNGDKQEVEVEGIEGGKVLLLKVQDKVHATSANCTSLSHTTRPTITNRFSKVRTSVPP
jgi:nitrite reductase/ring-hydroxylating ferredoxin subunit